MKTSLEPANSKARALLKKLLALAERGIDGVTTSAQRKIRRLKGRFDFSAPEPAEIPDLFSGSFKPSATATPIYAFAIECGWRKPFTPPRHMAWPGMSQIGQLDSSLPKTQ